MLPARRKVVLEGGDQACSVSAFAPRPAFEADEVLSAARAALPKSRKAPQCIRGSFPKAEKHGLGSARRGPAALCAGEFDLLRPHHHIAN
jgi:hypothetical protein